MHATHFAKKSVPVPLHLEQFPVPMHTLHRFGGAFIAPQLRAAAAVSCMYLITSTFAIAINPSTTISSSAGSSC